MKPAVNGVLSIFKACYSQSEPKIKRVVLTSSLVAISGDQMEDRLYTEKDFASAENTQPYSKSKILAEKAAWDFVKSKENYFELAVINSGFIVGPVNMNFI